MVADVKIPLLGCMTIYTAPVEVVEGSCYYYSG